MIHMKKPEQLGKGFDLSASAAPTGAEPADQLVGGSLALAFSNTAAPITPSQTGADHTAIGSAVH
jgi:hypothetical protein